MHLRKIASVEDSFTKGACGVRSTCELRSRATGRMSAAKVMRKFNSTRARSTINLIISTHGSFKKMLISFYNAVSIGEGELLHMIYHTNPVLLTIQLNPPANTVHPEKMTITPYSLSYADLTM